VTHVTGYAYRPAGFPVVNVDFELLRRRQSPFITTQSRAAFRAIDAEARLLLPVAVVGQRLVPETMS